MHSVPENSKTREKINLAALLLKSFAYHFFSLTGFSSQLEHRDLFILWNIINDKVDDEFNRFLLFDF